MVVGLHWLLLRLGARMRAQAGIVRLHALLVAIVLIVAYQLYPQAFHGFLAFLHDSLMQGLQGDPLIKPPSAGDGKEECLGEAAKKAAECARRGAK
jgi:hypothetical protein